MNDRLNNALAVVSKRGATLGEVWHFDWPSAVQQAVHRLTLGSDADRLPPLVAVVGGASSGKSTVFNNLLDAHLVSRITARGHSTLGPILAAHEDYRPVVEELLGSNRLLPGYRRLCIELDDNASGEPDAVATVFHTIGSLREALLFDLPDFTSEVARLEGEVSLNLLPWFDRIVVVVDPERWFDRQSISALRADSVRFGQQRLAVFNRTREEALSDDQHAALLKQADRLVADGMLVLEFRRGRGFCTFPPETLEEVRAFVQGPRPERTGALLAQVAEAANRTLNQNEERAARLHGLRSALRTAVERGVPSEWDCMTTLMTPPERKQLEVVSRVLRLRETGDWLSAQARRGRTALQQLPVLGAVVGAPRVGSAADRPEGGDRLSIATAYYEAVGRRLANEVQRVVRSSPFWDEVRRWTRLEPSQQAFEVSPAEIDDIRVAAQEFDDSLTRWTAKVDAECKGVAPNIKGAIGVGAVGLAAILIAVPGPLSALTLVAAKGAIGSALGQLAAATGAGALLGRPVARLVEVVQEKLIGSEEFDAVKGATAAFRERLELVGQRLAGDAMEEAQALVLPDDHPLAEALEELREPPESA